MELSMNVKFVEWRMNCAVNGSDFEFSGSGRGDAVRGEVRLDLKSTGFPEGFEPVSCPMICNAPISIGFARNDRGTPTLWETAGGLLNVEPARVGAIYDARGVELLRLSVTSVVSVKNETVNVSNEMKGFSHLPPLAKAVVPVEENIVPNGVGGALSSIRFKLLTKAGEVLTGLTLVPYRWQADRPLSAPLVRTYEAVDVQWDGQLSVQTYIRSALQSAAEVRPDLSKLTSDYVSAHA